MDSFKFKRLCAVIAAMLIMCIASAAHSADSAVIASSVLSDADAPGEGITSAGAVQLKSGGKPKQSKPQAKEKKTAEKRTDETIKAPKEVRNGSRRHNAQRESIYDFIHARNKNLSRQTVLRYADYIVQACEKYRQDPFAVTAMIVHESTARNNAVSSGGDYGLMQVRWKVHHKSIKQQYPHIKKADDLFDPKYNILIGTEIFADYRNKAGDITGGLLRYSAGNRQLVRKIFASMEKLEKLYQHHLKNPPKKHDQQKSAKNKKK